MAVTSYKLPTSVIQNGTGVNAWADPNNILLVDGDFAVASGPASEILVGGFNISLGQLDTITNITLKVKGYRGSYNTTLAIYAVDDTSGVEISYPYAPSFQGFDGTNTVYTLASSLFGTTWTPDQINNIKIKLVADGTLYLDSVQLAVTYTEGVTPVPVAPSSGQIVVDEFVQGIRFQLAQAMTSNDLFLFAESFTMPDGTNIEYADFYGEALITVDQGILGSEENIRISNVEHDYNGTGLVRISIDSLSDRGLGFIYPYTTDATRRKAHGGTAEFVISNSAPFYNRFLRKNQIDALVSAPIYISDENVQLTDPAHELDFRGSGVTVVNDGSDSFKKIVTIQGTGVSTPVVVNTSSSTTGDAQAATLTWSHVSSGIDRLLVVQVITEAAKTITGITYNGIALTQEVTATNGTLRSEQWILVAPTIGTYDIEITMSGNSYITAGAETFTSVNQTTPTGNTSIATGSSLLITDTITTTVDNSIIVDSVGTGVLPMAYTIGAGQSNNWAITVNPNVRQGASSIEGAGTTPDNITMSWNIIQSTPWVSASLEICGIPSAVNLGVLSVTGLNTDNTDPQNPIVEISVDGSSITGDGTPGSPLVATAGPGASLVKATATDTTAGYLDDKISLVSNDGSVAITKTINNPAGNEEIEYDLSALLGGGGGSKLAIDTTQISTNNQTFTTLYTVPIPGGILGTNNAIRFKVLLGNLQIAANKDLYVKFVYGGSDVTGTLLFDNDSSSGSGVPGVIEGVIVADNATNAQKGYSQILWQENGTHNTPVSYGTGTVDASVSQNLELQVRFSDTGCIIRADTIIVEKITDGNDINNIEFFDDFIQNVKTAADGATERGVSGNFIIEQIGGADPAYVALGSSETNHPGIVDLTGGELYGFTNVDSGFTSTETRTIPVGNDFNFSGLFRSTRPGGSFGSIFGLCIDGASGVGGGIWVRFNSSTSATKILFYDGAVQTTTAINLPTSNTWTTFEIDWTAGTSTLVFKIGGTTVYSGTPTFTGTHVGFYAGGVGGTAGTKLSFDYITTTYTVTR